MVRYLAAAAYNFAVIPTVASRHPLWENRIGSEGALSSIDRGMLLDHGKETVGDLGARCRAGHRARDAGR